VILGRSIVYWVIVIVVAIIIFIVAKWAIPELLSLLGVSIPDLISTCLALLIALGWVLGGYSYRRTPVA
jgi:Na+-translocating ferredoxin:NAD+ oxidoreductase RnfA subunit